jgi:curved DNA-binding protein CbpA
MRARPTKAFRSLARELHPDVSDAPDADARFREVVEAYEVPEVGVARAYDRYGTRAYAAAGSSPGTSTSAACRISSRRSSVRRRSEAGGSRGADCGHGGDRLVEAARVREAPGAVPGRGRVRALRRRRSEPAPRERLPHVRRCRTVAAGVAQRLRRVVPTDVRSVLRFGRKIETRALSVPARAACSTSARSRSTSRPASTTGSASDHGAGARGTVGNACR